MENQYKRMVLLPESDYDQLKEATKNVLPVPLSSKFWTRDQANWTSDESTEREQKLYELSLAKQRASKTSSISAPSLATTEKKADFATELAIFPVTSRVRAQRLYASLEKNRPSLIDWNKTGEVIFGQHGAPFHGSNLIDLIHHATATKRQKTIGSPVGWAQFLHVLKQINIPTSLLNTETREEMHEGKEETVVAEEEEEPVVKKRKSTPKRLLRSKKWIRA